MRIWCFRKWNFFSENAGALKSMEIVCLLYVPMKYGIIDVIITLRFVLSPLILWGQSRFFLLNKSERFN